MSAAEAIQHGAIGIAKRGENVIALHPCIPFENAQDSMLHEVLHFLWVDFHLGDTGEEEHVVSTMATGLTHALQQNPELTAWLMAPAEEAP